MTFFGCMSAIFYPVLWIGVIVLSLVPQIGQLYAPPLVILTAFGTVYGLLMIAIYYLNTRVGQWSTILTYTKYKKGPKTSAKKQRDGFGAEMLRDCQISPLMIFMISDLSSVLFGVDLCRCHPLFAVESLCLMTKPTISDG